MWFFILKVIISGIIVAVVSLLGQKYPTLGGIIGAMPIISILAISFLYYESGGDLEKIGNLSFSIGWFVLSSGLFLLLLPTLLRRGYSFSISLLISFIVLVVVDIILIYAMKKVG
jgi:hypothetical protein